MSGRFVLDACVLFPTVMRQMLLGAAEAGFYAPRWSERLLDEWRRAAVKHGKAAALQAEGEIARVSARFREARLAPQPGLEARLWLPDPADVHVLAVAVAGSCDGIVTVNAGDFPRGVLAEEGLTRVDPDAFLLGFLKADPVRLRPVAQAVLADARRLSGEDWEMRGLMRKARLPRLGKALAG